jgi:uncharacterized membrane protein YbaN (DUF454 family)
LEFVKSSEQVKRGAWIALGTMMVGIGGVGVVIPVLPTTPFLLVAAFCYARGSKRLHDQLLNSRYLGAYIRAYERKEDLGWEGVAATLAILWAGMLVSLVLIDSLMVQAVLLIIGVLVTAHVLSLRKRA